MDKKELNNLLINVQNGDETSFTVIYENFYKQLYSFIYSILGNNSFVDDLIQDTFIKVRKNIQSYKSGTNGSAWIFQIAKNICFDFIRREKKHTSFEPNNMDYLNHEKQQSPELCLCLHDFLIKNLSEEERMIFILHVENGYKNHEIAQILNLPLGTVLWKYNKTTKKLKKLLKEEI